MAGLCLIKECSNLSAPYDIFCRDHSAARVPVPESCGTAEPELKSLREIKDKLDALAKLLTNHISASDIQMRDVATAQENLSGIEPERWDWLKRCLQLMADDNKAKIDALAKEIDFLGAAQGAGAQYFDVLLTTHGDALQDLVELAIDMKPLCKARPHPAKKRKGAGK